MGGRAVAVARLRAESGLAISCALLVMLVVLALAGLNGLDRESRTEGLRQRVGSLPPTQQAVEVTTAAGPPMTSAGPADGSQDAVLRENVAAALPGVPLTVWASARTSQTPVLAPQVAGAGTVVVASYDDLPALAELVAGDWPQGSAADQATMQADAAESLGVDVGESVEVALAAGTRLTVVGTWRIRPGMQGAVAGSVLETTGRLTGNTVGPLVPADPGLLEQPQRVWRIHPDSGRLDLGSVRALAAGLPGLEDRITRDPRLPAADVSEELRDALEPVERQATRTSVIGQVALALVTTAAVGALLVVGRLLAQRRAGQLALLRARGAAWRQVAGWTVLELVALSAPALLLAGVVAATGWRREAGVMAWCALAAVVVLAAPTLLASRRWQAVQRASGAGGRAAAVRWGVELVVLAGAAVALWLARGGPQLMREPAGRPAGLDPMVALAPALTLLAGALVTARVVVLVSAAAARTLSRRQSPAALLAAWQLSRSPGHHVVVVVLLVLLVGSGVVVAGERSTRSAQQARQAELQVGADIRVLASSPTGPGHEAAVDLAAALGQVEGVSAVTAVGVQPASSSAGKLSLVSVTSEPDAVARRVDGPPPGAAAGATVDITYTAEVDSEPVETPSADVPPGSVPTIPGPVTLRLTTWWLSTQGYSISRDLDSLLVATEPGARTSVQGTAQVRLPDLPGDETLARWHLAALDVRAEHANEVDRSVTVRLDEVVDPAEGPVRGSAPDETRWRAVALPGEVDAASSVGETLPAVVMPLSSLLATSQVRLVAGAEDGALSGADPVPAVAVTAELAAALGVGVGSTVQVRRTTGTKFAVAQVRGAVPGTPGPAMVVDARTLALADLAAGRDPDPHEQWQLTLTAAVEAAGDSAPVTAAVMSTAAAQGVPVEVQDRRDVLRRLTQDPLSRGSSRLLVVAGIAVALLALAGVSAAAASAARLGRRDEAVLAVLGADRRQQRRAGMVRGLLLAVLCAVAGAGTGVLVVLVGGPSLVADSSALGAAVPVRAQIPWGVVALIASGGMLLATATTVARGWSPGRGLAAGVREEAL